MKLLQSITKAYQQKAPRRSIRRRWTRNKTTLADEKHNKY